MSMDSSIAIEPLSLEFGRSRLTLDVRPDRLIPLQRAATPPALADPAVAVAEALEQPLQYPALRRAITPDDHVTIVVDENMPRLRELVTPILEHVTGAGVSPDRVTLLCPPGPNRQTWIDDLPDAFEEVRLEVHDPTDRGRIAYLASTKSGRRIYLNRAAVDADLLVVLSRPRFDAVLGYGGAEGAVYPALSDAATLREWEATATSHAPTGHARPARREAGEVSWLLGAPFYVQVIEGPGDDIVHVVGGPADTAAEGRRWVDRCWRATVSEPADVVLATMAGDPQRQTMADIARALCVAARVVRSDGAIALLSEAGPVSGEAFRRITEAEEPEAALDALRASPAGDFPAAIEWLDAARHARIYLLSGLAIETAESLFTTPLPHARQVKRLIDAGGSLTILPDAHKLLVELRPPAGA
jgi:nickel-dependent lactate racemase